MTQRMSQEDYTLAIERIQGSMQKVQTPEAIGTGCHCYLLELGELTFWAW